MEFNLDQRTASLSVGEFAEFTTGPHDAGGGRQGVWRAQLGTRWHNELRARAAAETPAAEFELAIHEVVDGPFDRNTTEWAAWAPEPGDPTVDAYLVALKKTINL